MLVLCVGMYRACSTWQYGVAALLLERHRGGRRLGFADGDQFVTDLEPTLDPSGWSILKAHNAHVRFAELLAGNRALAIYSHRDLRDVAFSWMHKTGATFAEIVERNFLPLCLHNDWFWRGRPATLLQSYEDLIAEPVRGVEEIARHLQIDLEPGEAAAIAEATSLESNRKRTEALSERLQAEGVPLDSKDLDHYDRQTLLHWNHLRSGRAGAWRDVATPEEKATIARICGPWLVARGYEVDQSWAAPLAWEAPGRDLPRISHARNAEDILLDRLFRGQIGTYVDVGADHPTHHNSTYFFHLRGWRGTNLVASPSTTAVFAGKRPEDLSLAPDAPGDEVGPRDAVLSGLIEKHGPIPPDFFAIHGGRDVAMVLRGIPLATWRPQAFVIEADHPESWESILIEAGYLPAAFDGINRFYLRGDLADSLYHFNTPVNALDDFTRAESGEHRERAESLERLLEEERRRVVEANASLLDTKVELAELKVRFGDELESRHGHYLAWLEEREGWRVEREALEVERQASQAELHALQAEGRNLRDELDVMARRIEELEGYSDALALEVGELRGQRDRLEGEIHARDVEIDRTRTKLGPYLKIDRLGVVTAIQRRVHAHRSHSKA